MRSRSVRWVVVLAVAGCQEHGASVRPIDAAPDVPRAACIIENVLAARIAGAMPLDCGHLAVDGSDAAFLAARSCVLTAVVAQDFVVMWDIQGIDSRVAGAYLGLGGNVLRFHYDGDPGGGGGEAHPVTTIGSCTGVADLGNCTSLRQTLCLQCTNEALADSCGPS